MKERRVQKSLDGVEARQFGGVAIKQISPSFQLTHGYLDLPKSTQKAKFVLFKNAIANVARGSAAALVAILLPPFLTRLIDDF